MVNENIVNWVQGNLNSNPTPIFTEHDISALKWAEAGAMACNLPKTEQKCRNILNGIEQADENFMGEVRNAYTECGCFVNEYYLYLKERR